MNVDPTEQCGVRLRRPESRDPFLTVNDATSQIRQAVAAAIQSIVPAGTSLKLSNILIDNGKVNAQNIVVEIRATTKIS